jgi:hypothetical protein
MRKSAKRGEPQIFLLCVTLWASAGGVVSARAFASPSPRHRQKTKARHLGLDTLEEVLGPSFLHKGKRDTRNEAAKKPFRGRYSSLVGPGVPLFLERKGGDEGEERASPVLHPPFDNPTIAVQENGTYGGQGKAAGFVGRRLCCVNSAFLCWLSLRKKSRCSEMRVP